MIRRLIILLLIVGCDNSTEPEDCAGVAGGTAVKDCAGVCEGTTTQEVCDECPSSVFDCTGVCEGTSIVDECGVCGGNGMQTTYVQECEYQEVCNWQDVRTGNQYCSSSSCYPNQSCQTSSDCMGNTGFASSCDNNSMCMLEYESQYICSNQNVCEDIPTTSCPIGWICTTDYIFQNIAVPDTTDISGYGEIMLPDTVLFFENIIYDSIDECQSVCPNEPLEITTTASPNGTGEYFSMYCSGNE